MPFCFAPWTNIDISPLGGMSPCCKFLTEDYEQKFNIGKNTIKQYSQSDFVNSIKQQFLQDTWPAGCTRCKIEEENNIRSKRQLDHDRWQHNYEQYNIDTDQFITASVSFGNTCNLTCITCNAAVSSKWHQEYKQIYLKDIKNFHFYKEDFVQNFVDSAPALTHIDVTGGEPFISGVEQQKNLLRYYIQTDQAKSITLHYTTNVTTWPDSEWWQLWQNFKEIDMQLSIDGIGDRYNYIRYPGNWSQIQTNINSYLQHQNLPNFRLSVSHTVSAYNVYYLDEFISWCHSVGLPKPWLGRVHQPSHMQPAVWSLPARAFIADNLHNSKHQDVQTWAKLLLNSDDSEHFDTFKNYLRAHDQYRRLNFSQTFPELAPYI